MEEDTIKSEFEDQPASAVPEVEVLCERVKAEEDPLVHKESSNKDVPETYVDESAEDDPLENSRITRKNARPRRISRVSMSQLDTMWDFLNSNRDIAVALNRSMQDKEYSMRKWKEVANVLNALEDGAHKDWRAWSKYWVDYKAKLKRRNAAVRSCRQTGGGPATEQPLTELEEKFSRILGEDFCQGVPGPRADPLLETTTTDTTSDSIESHSNHQETPQTQEDQELQHIKVEEEDVEMIEEPAVFSPPIAEEMSPPEPHRRRQHEEMIEAPSVHSPPNMAEEIVPPESRRRRHHIHMIDAPVHSPPMPEDMPPSRRRRRQAEISREEARRLLIQTARDRTAAAVRSSAAMEGMLQSLTRIADSLALMLNHLVDIKRVKKELKCQECFEIFTSQGGYDEHVLEHDDSRHTYPCTTCKKAFPSKTGLLNHMRVHIAMKTRVYKCLICQKTFEMNKELIKHKTEHQGTIFTCRLAKKCNHLTFTDHCEYLIHQFEHYNNLKPKCDECEMYVNAGYMKRHIMSHADRRQSCNICGIVCSGNYLRSHMKFHETELKCVECGKICLGRSVYEQHMRKHTGVKKLQCLYCGKGFNSVQQRKIHTMVHTDEKPYKCNLCGHRSRQKGTAEKHLRTHSNEKRYECDYCNKKFYHKTSILAHIRQHTKSRLYYCKDCDFSTPTKPGLRSHLVHKHLKEKPYRCEVCDISFKTNQSLSRHNTCIAHRNNMFGADKKRMDVD